MTIPKTDPSDTRKTIQFCVGVAGNIYLNSDPVPPKVSRTRMPATVINVDSFQGKAWCLWRSNQGLGPMIHALIGGRLVGLWVMPRRGEYGDFWRPGNA